ncbi:MAG: AzlD domain-containing protein [Pseudolysinimonas sp.]
MTIWNAILLASLIVLVLKLAGYLVPPSFMERPGPSRVATLLTVALLSALVVTQTIERDHQIVLDARVPAVGVAALLLVLRAPFIVVVLSAAVVAAVLRLLGWMA